MDLVSLIEIGQMHFDSWKRNRLDDVVQCHAGEAVARWIDDGAINVVDVRLKCVHKDTFVIGLLNNHLDIEFRSNSADLLVDELQRFQTVNIRLTPAKQIRVRTMQNQKSKPAGTI